MILICIVADDRKKDTFPVVIEAIFKMIDHTSRECDVFVVHEEKELSIIKTCEEKGLTHTACQVMSYEEFNRTLRTTSFTVFGYDEYFPQVVGTLRNVCIDEAIKRKCEHIFFVDADNTVDVDALDKLLAADKKDIAGWYYLKNSGAVSCGLYPPEGTEPFKAFFAICGCRLIHRDVFEAVRFVFRPLKIDDMSFSDNVIKEGFDIYIHPGVYSDHIGGGYTDEARDHRDACIKKQDI